MARPAFHGRAGGWRALCSILLAVGGLVACGPEQDDAALAASAAVAPAPPAGVAECRRWTTCVPENPCHTGWVTGCRKNVPICTDIGGWLSNGTTCGADLVCFMGECVPCDAGASCPIADMYGNADPCRVGAIACDSGQPVCVEQGPAPDGTACGGGGPYVCKDGACTFCMEGYSCTPPEGSCHSGVWTACATATCTDTGVLPNGSWCDYAAVCRDGDCVPCSWGAPCTPSATCWPNGTIECSTGWPVCTPQWPPSPDGTPCDGGACYGGQCLPPCNAGEPCTPANACFSGVTVCWDAYNGYCQEQSPLPDGTSCGESLTCRAGSCTSCGPGAWCPSPDPCYGQGTISCATARCEPTPPSYDDGWSCGVGGETCQSAVCTDDADPRLLVRSASWSVDLTGTSWVQCTDLGDGTSRRATRTWGLGTQTRTVETFAAPGCGGDPLTSTVSEGTALSAGDRYAGWTGGTPPPGVWTWNPTATAVRITGTNPDGTPSDIKTLLWVDDWSMPRRLYLGDRSQALGADGYPTLLAPAPNPVTEVIPPCVPDQPCTPGDACFAGVTVCWSEYQGYCEQREPLPDGASCGDGLVCSSGSCLTCGSPCPSPDSCHASGAISCATGRCEPQPPPYEDGLVCGVGGETCQGGTCTPVDGADPWVRSTYGAVDLAGTTWFDCMPDEPAPGMSRLRIDTYVTGGATHRDVIFPSAADCTGPTDPAQGGTFVGTLTSGGDRLASWSGGYVPPGLPWSLLATGMHVSVLDTPEGPIAFKELIFVDDAVSPRQLYSGESKSPDFYPSQLEGSRPMAEVTACDAGATCSPGQATCEVFQIDCSVGVPICAGTGTFLPEGTSCGEFLRCQGNACLPVPTRTVTGTAWTTYWPDEADVAGPLQTTDPAPLYQIATLQWSGDASAWRPGLIFPDGTFAIPDVYDAPYFLELWTPTGLAYVHEAAAVSTLDLGVDLLGRRDLALAWTNPTQVLFTVRDLAPWTAGDVVEFASSNAGVAALPFGPQEGSLPPPGTVEFTRDFPWYGRPLVDAAAGDVAYVFQGATTSLPGGERVTAASGFSEVAGLTLLDGLGGTVDATLGACTGAGAISVDWRRSEFEALAALVHPEAAHGNHRVVVGARPHQSPFAPGFRSGELAQYPGLPLLVAQANAGTGDAVLALSFGRFLPPLWREYRHDRHMMTVAFTAPGALTPARVNAPLGYDVSADAVAGSPAMPFLVTPVLAPPTGLLIAGVDAWSGASGVGTTPVVSWTAPAPSPAAAALFPDASLQYRVTVYEVRPTGDGLGTQAVLLFEGKTRRTSFRLPGTGLVPGGRYVVAVTARLTADLITAPRRTSIEEAYATVVSREFTP